jgi:hypothetical protein
MHRSLLVLGGDRKPTESKAKRGKAGLPPLVNQWGSPALCAVLLRIGVAVGRISPADDRSLAWALFRVKCNFPRLNLLFLTTLMML